MQEPEAAHIAAVKRVVERINGLWLSKQYEAIGELLDEDVVIAPPGLSGRIRGREAYVQSYRDYDKEATTHQFSPSEPEIDIVGETAIAKNPFFVMYEIRGKVYRESGYDLLVLSRSTGEWRVVWRTMHSEPDEQEPA